MDILLSAALRLIWFQFGIHEDLWLPSAATMIQRISLKAIMDMCDMCDMIFPLQMTLDSTIIFKFSVGTEIVVEYTTRN